MLNCTLKASPAESNTEALARIVTAALAERGVEPEMVRVADYDVRPGVTNDEGDGDEWPVILEKVLAAHILVVATPTWLGKPASVTQRVMERMDALLSETDDEERPVAYNKVAGIVVTGNEDGAHHVIAETAGSLIVHRLHGARAGVDLLEQGSRPRAQLSRVRGRRRQGLVSQDGPGRGFQPGGGGHRPAPEPDPTTARMTSQPSASPV